jgi:hypothetical protein
MVVLLAAARLAAQVPESRDTRPAAPEKITFELLTPAAESRPAESRGPQPAAVIRITNRNDAPATLWPFVALEIRDAKGVLQKPSSRRGRWGVRRETCLLEAVDFVTLEPGKSIDWTVKLDQYGRDPDAIVGWKLKPGRYVVTARYAFSRSDFVARCKSGCRDHGDAGRPWNGALEATRQATLEIVVR